MNNFLWLLLVIFGLAFWTKRKHPKGALLYWTVLITGLVAIGYFGHSPTWPG
jgi:hypothetical protein